MSLILSIPMPPTTTRPAARQQLPTLSLLGGVSRIVRSWRRTRRMLDHRRLSTHMTSDIGLLPEHSTGEPLWDRGAVMWRPW
jgi:hypothetical protein